jgi:hypothetical protein
MKSKALAYLVVESEGAAAGDAMLPESEESDFFLWLW